jgi:hypothetical protein
MFVADNRSSLCPAWRAMAAKAGAFAYAQTTFRLPFKGRFSSLGVTMAEFEFHNKEIVGNVFVSTKNQGDMIRLLEEALAQAIANEEQLGAGPGEEKQLAFKRLNLDAVFTFVHRS